MEKFAGTGICPGRVVGPVYRMAPAVEAPDEGETWDRSGTSVEAELARLTDAARAVQAELHSRADTAGGDAKALLETTALMAADPMLLQSANAEIVAGVSAERSIWEAGGQVAEMLKGLGGYMARRMPDVLDVRSRIVAELRGQPAAAVPSPGVPFILAATYLAPADAATLDPAIVIGIVTTSGGPQSETAVLARNFGIPTVVGVRGTESLGDGATVYLDGTSGDVIREPGESERMAASLWAGHGRGPVTRSL
ncbi:phosphoenolpyruvate-utilizing N-terminal domain-containing protein [Arthrobacter roseus]|uniref:phosphoenolpyruvate-utilizing N-terminal domain-containing protein n=1 Tax=Arthrobacter roseus TaxID=136274 RepID=UPI001965D546|nr:phosphoenolpyruvate-utilizing N-terminal domain-containing protein [Arthrobacter roseus]MBM7847322.1 phosphoenolpyruvate-protein kinase (PTS system EI component) [Arthrobacter roseus]